MKLLPGLLLIAALAPGRAVRDTDGAGQLFEKGVKLAEKGRFESARATLQTLIDVYPGDSLAVEARHTIDATLLFEEGRERLKAGKYGTARVTFQTLVAVYPECFLAKQAERELRVSEKLEQSQPGGLLVRSIRYEQTQPVTVDEIQQRFREREVPLAAERRYNPREIEEARAALAELLAERGAAGARVQAETRIAGAHSLDVVFIVDR